MKRFVVGVAKRSRRALFCRGAMDRNFPRLVRIVFAVGCTALLAVLTQDARARNAAEVVREVQRRYDSTRDYSAEFHQTTEYRTLNRSISGRGNFYFSRPGKMLWRYEEPAGQFLLSDGRHFYFYQPAERQVIKTAVRGASRSDLPLSFLLGVGKLERDFRAELLESSADGHRLRLIPRRADTGLREIILTADAERYDVRRVRIEDGGGNLWTFGFENIRRGVGLDPSVFRLRVPQGVDIVEFGS